MKLLLSCAEVKKIIAETRKRIGIPEEGLGDEQQIEQWHKKDDLRCDSMMSSSKFAELESEIYKKLQDGEITQNKAKELTKELYRQIPVDYLYSQIWKIIRQFNMPDNYEHHIYKYILYGIITAPIANYVIGPFSPWEKLRDVRRVPITVYAKLTDKDLRDLKLQINQYFGGKVLTFIQDVRDISRDLESEKTLAEKEYDYTTGEEVKLSAEDVAERIFGSRRKKKEVFKARERLRKLRKTRFGKQ